MTPLRCVSLSFVWLGLLAMPAAHAADPAPARTGNTLTVPGGQPTGHVAGRLTRDQLRECLSQQQSLKDQDAATGRAQAELQAQKTELQRERDALEAAGAVLDAERTTVDATQAKAVAAYNAKLVQHRELLTRHEANVDAHNTKLRPFNEQVQVLNAARASWLGACGDRTYDEADHDAIQRGK